MKFAKSWIKFIWIMLHIPKLIYFVEDRPGHDRRYAIDPKKIKNELYWKVENPFSTNLEYTVKWYLENIDWSKKVLKVKV